MGGNVTTNPAPERRNPGDEARPGAPQTGEIACPACQGSGRDANRAPCANCGGTGKVIVTVGDA
jgi:RecJ-like exonuclease